MAVASKEPKEVAEIVYLLHGAKSTDPKLYQGLAAIFTGVTSSHAGALLRFSNQQLFEKYIKHSGIPYSITQENGISVYGVEINFGPNGAAGLGDTKTNGILYSNLEAWLSTNFLTPVFLTKKGEDILKDKNVISSKIFPALKKTIHIGITTTVHENLIPDKFRSVEPQAMRSALLKFTEAIESAETIHAKEHKYDVFMASVNKAFEDLKQVLAPDMSLPQFKGEIDKFITFGTPAKQSVTTKLVTDSSQGLSLERMLQYLVEPKNLEPYNLLLNNCAHYLRGMYMYAAQDNPHLKKVFENGMFSEENVLGKIASLVSPHKKLGNQVDPADLSTPVILARMLQKLPEAEAHNQMAAKPRLNAFHKHKTGNSAAHHHNTHEESKMDIKRNKP